MAANEAEDKALAQNAQMNKLFRVLAVLNANVMSRVMTPEGSAAKIQQAINETRSLINAANLNHKCPAGTIWDESQRRCVPLE
jgi:hypothetical protein